MSKHFIIPDTQVRAGDNPDYLLCIGKKIIDEKPDVIVMLGDFFDLPSLSSYDVGRKCEGRRLLVDLNIGNTAMRIMTYPLLQYNLKQRRNKKAQYLPKMVFLLGNHENRLKRHVDAHPNLEGVFDEEFKHLEKFGWEVVPFLEPKTIDGITYAHYFYQPNSGRPYGGTAVTKLKNIGTSFTMGHVQGCDWANLPRPDGTQRMGLVVGSCYEHYEDYKGPQANNHWRGIVIKHNVKDGCYDPEFISLDTLKESYALQKD